MSKLRINAFKSALEELIAQECSGDSSTCISTESVQGQDAEINDSKLIDDFQKFVMVFKKDIRENGPDAAWQKAKPFSDHMVDNFTGRYKELDDEQNLIVIKNNEEQIIATAQLKEKKAILDLYLELDDEININEIQAEIQPLIIKYKACIT